MRDSCAKAGRELGLLERAKSLVKWELQGLPSGDDSKWGSLVEDLEFHEQEVVLSPWAWGLGVVEVGVSSCQHLAD